MKIQAINSYKPVLNSARLNSVPVSSKPAPSYPRIDKLSNINYVDFISFKGTMPEHRSYGVAIYRDSRTKNKKVSFKVATFEDADKVIANVFKEDSKGQKVPINSYPLENKGNGIFEKKGIPVSEVKNGYKYNFTVFRNGEQVTVKDPYSKRQKDFFGYSTVYDHSLFKWKNDAAWKANPARISRIANDENNLTHFRKAKIYEVHIPTFTEEGTFESAKEKLQQIKDIGFNTIEIMPVENTYDFNWGYDGVDKLAAAEYMGGPDKLKDLIDTAHSIGLNVYADVVYNHTGPNGNDLSKAGPFIGGGNEFGDAFNFEGKDKDKAKDFIANAAISWLDNYHFDGLRLDMTSKMGSDFALAQLVAEIHYHYPDAVIIAEDGRDSETKVTAPLEGKLDQTKKTLNEHLDSINYLKKCADENDQSVLGGLGCDSRWAFPYHHILHRLLYDFNNTGCTSTDKTFDLMQNFINVCHNSQYFVNFFSSHDEQGNNDGTRKVAKLLVKKLNLAGDSGINKDDNRTIMEKAAVYLSDEDMERVREYIDLKNEFNNPVSYDDAVNVVFQQKAQLVAEKLAKLYQCGEIDKYAYPRRATAEQKKVLDKKLNNEILNKIGIKQEANLTYAKIRDAFEKSAAQMRMAAVVTYAKPGQKMVFQGDEDMNLSSFRFARKFDPGEQEKDNHIITTEKGYKAGEAAFNASKLDSLNSKYSKDGIDRMDKFRALTIDAIKLNDENDALTTGHLVRDYEHTNNEGNRVVGLHSYDSKTDNQIYTIVNFDDKEYSYKTENPYKLVLPEGKWIEVLNSDDTKYGGGGLLNRINDKKEQDDENIFVSYGDNQCSFNIPAYSAVVLKKID